jgi:hypothetical protein
VIWWAVSIDVESAGVIAPRRSDVEDGRLKGARFTEMRLADGTQLIGLRVSVAAPDQESALDVALNWLTSALPGTGAIARKAVSVEGDLNVRGSS